MSLGSRCCSYDVRSYYFVLLVYHALCFKKTKEGSELPSCAAPTTPSSSTSTVATSSITRDDYDMPLV